MRKSTSCINAYVSETMLVLFLFTLLFLSLISVYSAQRVDLMKAMHRSTMDLSCISHAKGMIENNTMVRKCHWDESRLVLYKQEEIKDRLVEFTDHETYIFVQYMDQGKQFEMKIFYSDNAIVSIES